MTRSAEPWAATPGYRRAVPAGADRGAVPRLAVLAVAETLARLGRELPVRLVAGERAADVAAVPAELRARPAGSISGRLTPAIGPAAPDGLLLTVTPGRPAGPTGPGWPGGFGRRVPGAGGGPAAVWVEVGVTDELRVGVACAPDDPWGRSAWAVAEMVGELLAALLADPGLAPADAPAIAPATRRAVLAVPPVDHGRFRPLAALVEAQVDAGPERTAVVHAGATLSYGRLDRLANGLAARLAAAGVGRGSVVPLRLGNSLELPVCAYALLKLGAAFVALDPHWPERRLAAACEVLDAPVTLATDPVPGALTVRVGALPESAERPGVDLGPDYLAYGVFTSGTTGTPRCALNTQRGLVNRLRFMTRWFGPAPAGGEVVLQNSKHTFDSAVWQLFWPLTTGGRTVVPATGDFLDLQQTVATLAGHGVTVTDFVPTTFNLLVARLERDPAALRSLAALRHLVVGGEEISPRQVHRLRALRPGLAVSNAYGPSETAIGMVFHRVEPADGDDVPLGRPIDNCAAVVVDERLRPVPPGAVGEIAIGGDCVGAGYLGAPEATAAKFVPNPFGTVPGPRLYRSGDLGWYDPAGRLHFAGRRDFQAKVGGVRVELGEVELAAESCPGVRQATALAAGGELAVFAAAGPAVTERALRDHLRGLLPRTSLPRHVLVLAELPLADSAKVDRAVLLDLLEERLARAAAVASEGGRSAAEQVLTAFRAALADPELPAKADFLAAGGDSLRAVALVAALRSACGVDVGVQDLLEHPTAAGMTGFVERQRGSAAVSPDERAAMDADAAAPLDALRDGPPRPGGPAGRFPGFPVGPAADGPLRTVLLTGASGFVGGQVAYELLAGTGADVVCLARDPDRLVPALAARGLWRDEWAGRLRAVRGDLGRPRLGLDPAAWAALAAADAVLHAGALVNFLYDYRAHRGANVLGPAELLRLAQHGRPVPLLHVSTLGVLDREAALHDGPLAEDVDPERVRPPETGYSRSKWVAERWLARAREAGATVTVLRLGEVLPGAAGPANPRALTHLLLTAFARLRAVPDVPLRSDWTPLDWAARVTVAALADPAVRGRDLHVLHPVSVPLTDVLPGLDRVPEAEFRRRVAAEPALATLAGVLGQHLGGLTDLVVDNPTLFRADAGTALATRAGLPPPELAEAMGAYARNLEG